MRRTVLISRRPPDGLRLATRAAEGGDEVTAVLLDGAAALARRGHAGAASAAAAAATGVRVLAHDEALATRAIHEPADAIEVVDLDTVADLVGRRTDRVVWA